MNTKTKKPPKGGFLLNAKT